MKKICLDIPENKQEAIALLVKSSVNNDDIDTWLIRSKKEHTLRKLEMLEELVNESILSITFIPKSEFDDIAKQVEQQVLELIVGFEE